MNEEENLLQVNNLYTWFYTLEGIVKAVDGVSFDLKRGDILGLVGESGCGKSMTVLSILKLFPSPPGKIVNGEVLFNGQDLIQLCERNMRDVRGKLISMIFQEPMTSLNPVLTIGYQIAEAIKTHQNVTKREALANSIHMLSLVGIPSPDKRIREYPHQLSGGMRQRAMIAMALACRPELLIADEPTTALDVTIQAQILDLILKLKEEIGTAIILITHNMSVVAEMCQRVAVMYAGRIVEMADVFDLFENPLHPYTQGLLFSMPRVDEERNKYSQPLKEISGTVPSLIDLPKGCKFANRCDYAKKECFEKEPLLNIKSSNHLVRCWLS